MRLIFNGIFCLTFRFISLLYHVVSQWLRICYNKTMNTKISFSSLDFPEQLRTYIEGANLSDSSSHSGARVLYLDSGYYLKIDQKGRLEREASIASWFEQEGIGTPVIHYLQIKTTS